ALHRHLRDLTAVGVLARRGSPPKTSYELVDSFSCSPELRQQLQTIKEILGLHPAVILVTLFGSQARGEARSDSDIDVLVWLEEGCRYTRQDIWQFWDRHSRKLAWARK